MSSWLLLGLTGVAYSLAGLAYLLLFALVPFALLLMLAGILLLWDDYMTGGRA